jgi:hypothetical protein
MRTDDVIQPDEYFPARWRIDADTPLSGTVAVAFVARSARSTGGATWYTAAWADETPGVSRTMQLMVAGSAASDRGVFPGVGSFAGWVRYVDAGSVRERPGGVFRFV